jgi:hypothetical protein
MPDNLPSLPSHHRVSLKHLETFAGGAISIPHMKLLRCLSGPGLGNRIKARKAALLHFLSFRTRSISYSAILIAAARLTGVTPDLFLPSANLISHRQTLSSVNWTTEYFTPLYSIDLFRSKAEAA